MTDDEKATYEADINEAETLEEVEGYVENAKEIENDKPKRTMTGDKAAGMVKVTTTNVNRHQQGGNMEKSKATSKRDRETKARWKRSNSNGDVTDQN
ncbi:hypothetical protein [Dolosigranulum pigrum]|uniref:hypothetical protein n=1 Tax=Dolosigranulum pigrum TaxID=29394 RepID=UPI0021B10DC1|nr:hypothetical protein [Dolosigranulum pigrum]